MTTANILDTVQPALRDRMETISLSGYTEEEKLEIAKRHLVPKQVEENGLAKDDVKFDRKALAKTISEYTQEAVASARMRSAFAVVARQRPSLRISSPMRITADNLKDYGVCPDI